MIQMHTILVPTDFSEDAKHALEYALEIASKFQSHIEILHVVENPVYAVPDLMVAMAGVPQQSYETFAKAQAEKLMAEFTRPLTERSISFTGRFEYGDARQVILNTAQQRNADMIVMGTHGRKGLDRWLVGSVAERIVREASCPVLTVHRTATA